MKEDNKKIVEEKFKKLKTAFFANKTRDIKWRKNQLNQLIKGIQEESEEIFAALEKDLGKDQFTAELYETENIINDITHLIKNLDGWSKPERVDTPLPFAPSSSRIVYQPLGVAVVIGAWNFPFVLTLKPVAYALAAGNCVLAKPSELSPSCSAILRKIMETYLDNECVQVVEGGAEVSIALSQLKSDIICFTGSSEKGKLVAQAAAKNLVPCILELGGKSITIVDSCANTDVAALKIVGGRFSNCGQICIAPDYVMVHESVKQELLDKMLKALKEMYTDDPKTSKFYSRIVNEFHTERVIELTKNTGGKILCGGDGDVKARYVAPTIIVDPKLDSKVMKEEIFGPVLPVISFKEFSEVVDHLNEREKPLAMYYFGNVSNNPEKEILENYCQSGGMVINDVIIHAANPELPFGGIGNSGIGKYSGKNGFRHFCNAKSVMSRPAINVNAINKLILPPFSESDKRSVRLLLKSRLMQSHGQKFGLFLLVLFVLFVLCKMGFLCQ